MQPCPIVMVNPNVGFEDLILLQVDISKCMRVIVVQYSQAEICSYIIFFNANFGVVFSAVHISYFDWLVIARL